VRDYSFVEDLLRLGAQVDRPPNGERDAAVTMVRRSFADAGVDFTRSDHAEIVLGTLTVLYGAVDSLQADQGIEAGQAFEQIYAGVFNSIYDTQAALTRARRGPERGGRR
jgi:hypothetical protein